MIRADPRYAATASPEPEATSSGTAEQTGIKDAESDRAAFQSAEGHLRSGSQELEAGKASKTLKLPQSYNSSYGTWWSDICQVQHRLL